jgi:hypothetical protein
MLEKSPFAALLTDYGHKFDRNSGVSHLHKENSKRKRVALKNIEITKAKSDDNVITLNESIPSFKLANTVYRRAS